MCSTNVTTGSSTQRRGLPKPHHHLGTHLGSDTYTSKQIYERERRQIFRKQWLCVAREEEVADVGDYMALQVAGEPLLLVRDRAGKLNAFLNMCLHRGAEIAFGSGNTNSFVCPYHAWTYDLDGRLRAAPRAAASGVDVRDCRLRAIQLQSWRGWIFVNFDPNAAPFESFIEQWEDELWYYQTDRCRIAFKTENIFKCNWKYVVENVVDFYHAGTVHADTFGKQFDFKAGPLPLKKMADGGLSAQLGTDTRKNDPPIFPRLPWLKPRPDFAAGKAAIFPNMNLFSNTDSIRTSTFWPIGVDQMQITLYFLLPESYWELPDFQERADRYRELTLAIAEEDRQVMESLQRTAASAFFTPGPVIDLEEGIRHIQNHYSQVIA